MDLFDYSETKTPPRFSIKRGIPIPTSREHTVKSDWDRPEFDFASMEIGDCFDVWPHDCGGPPLIVVQNMVSGAAATWRRKNAPGSQFTTRQIQGQFVRCWRVK